MSTQYDIDRRVAILETEVKHLQEDVHEMRKIVYGVAIAIISVFINAIAQLVL